MIYLNIGSNLVSEYGDRFDNINKAIKYLKIEKIKILKTSSFFETPSYPTKNYPKFINMAVEVKFSFNPMALLKKISIIEKKMGRKRKVRNEPRVCDIDIIDFKKMKKKTQKLILPHPRAHNRNFVLLPLKQISPNWIHPIFNKKIDVLINNLSVKSRNEITRLKERAIFK